MAVVGVALLVPRPPSAAARSPTCVLAATAAATGLLIWESGVAVGQYGSIFVWATLVAAYFFPRRVVAIVHLDLAARASTRSLWPWSKAPPATRR